jgi:hypothetical protein
MLRVLNKIVAFIVMGLIGWFVIGVPIMMLVLPGHVGDKDPPYGLILAAPGIAIVATLIVTILAPTGRIAWGRLCLMNGIVSLALPLVGMAFTVMVGHQMLQRDSITDVSSTTAAQAGVGIASIFVGGVMGFFGFFLGAIFLVLAYLFLKNAPRRDSMNTEAQAPG